MSEVVEEAKVAEDELLSRTFDASFSEGDGRTIDARIVPYGVEATVSDDGRGSYREMWMPGAFSNQVRGAEAGRARTVHVNYRHRQGFGDVIGHGLSLEERDDGFYGSFKILDGPDGDKALELVRADALSGMSLEAYAKKTERKGGIVQRLKGHLVGVALCPNPAFANAVVLAVREEQIVDESLLPPIPDLAIIERCFELGVDLPEGMAILLARAYTEDPWDGSESRWDTAEAYCAASAIDLNTAGGTKVKHRCHLPFKEPGSGAINVNGVKAALSEIGKGNPLDATQAQRDAAKSRLEKILTAFNSTSSST